MITVYFLDRDGALWTLGSDGVMRVFNRDHHEWMASPRGFGEIQLDLGPLEELPDPVPVPIPEVIPA